ncbi:MAG: hypothetical protein OEZ02_13930 [Anaerolineae bacterium]|nr:hypothetical protein [Anaerolineae bacterium]
MKTTAVCPKCSSKKIGYLENVIHRTDTMGDSYPVKGHAPAPLGEGRTTSTGILKVTTIAPVGQLEAYFCADCGFYETYVKQPSTIDFASIVGFKWAGAASA